MAACALGAFICAGPLKSTHTKGMSSEIARLSPHCPYYLGLLLVMHGIVGADRLWYDFWIFIPRMGEKDDGKLKPIFLFEEISPARVSNQTRMAVMWEAFKTKRNLERDSNVD